MRQVWQTIYFLLWFREIRKALEELFQAVCEENEEKYLLDLYYQEFKFQDADLRRWKHKWLKRLDMYHELMFDEKERVKFDIKEFEMQFKDYKDMTDEK